MTSNISTNTPVFSNIDKFNGSNFPTWSQKIRLAVVMKGAKGYLDRTIPKPPDPSIDKTSPTNVLLPDKPTMWTSRSPSLDEWEMRDGWVLSLMVYNAINPISVGMDMSKSAAENWKMLMELYQTCSDLAVVNAQRDLRNAKFNDGEDFNEHIANLQIKWSYANTVGAKVTDADF